VRGTSQRGRAARARLSAQAQPGRQRALGYRIGARRRPLTAGRAQTAAKARLARFRRGSRLAVALTALLLIVWGVDAPAQEQAADTTTAASPAETLSVVVPLDTAGVVADSLPAEDTSSVDAAASVGEATGTLRSLARGAARALPKVAIALGLLLAAALLARVARSVVRRLTS